MNTLKELKTVFRDTLRLFRLAWSDHKWILSMTALAVLCASCAPFVYAWAIGQMINELVTQSTLVELSQRSRQMLILALIGGATFALANTLQFFFKTVLYKELFHFLTVLIHKKVAELDIATHEDPVKKDLITKVQENAMWRAPDFMQRMAYLSQNLLEVVIATLVIASADMLVGVLIFAAALPRLWMDMRYNHELWKTETEVAEVRRKFWYARWFITDVRALTEVKLYQNVPFFVNLIGSHLGAIKARELKVERSNLRVQLFGLVCSEGATIFGICTFVATVLNGQLAIGSLMFYLGSLGSFRWALNSLSQNIGSQFRDGKFVHDMFRAFDLNHSLPIASSKPLLERIEEIIFENVSFRYPGTEKMVLKGINLQISGGSTLGLVAENGSGKSTLAKLLCRIYDPTIGRILVNGIDIREFELDYWQSQVGILLQDFSYFEHLDVTSIIRLGRSGKTADTADKAVFDAAEAAQAHEFIQALPRKYQTVVGQNFVDRVDLSGGQHQRNAIARLMYRNPKLAVFDEPTSAIDGQAESKIFDQIFNRLEHTTKILISHRLYTLRKADQICVIADGEIVERGSHLELLALGGTYAERYRKQAAEYH